MATPKETVLAFYNAIAQRDYDTLRRLGRPDYIQHNPAFETGLEGLIANLQARPPAPKPPPIDFVRVIAEDDLVMTLRRLPAQGERASLPGAELALVDIFRVQDGLVAEHWDYREQFPRGSAEPKNPNGRF